MVLLGCSSGGGDRRGGAVLVGDSLLYEARTAVRRDLPAGTTLHAVPGAAACDLRPWLRSQLASTRPAVVVIETAGNVVTPCIRAAGAPRSDGALRRSVTDVVALVDLARRPGARVLVVDPPPLGAISSQDQPWLTRLFDAVHHRLRGRSGVSFTDRPSRSVAPDGRFVVDVPCRTGEAGCHAGSVTVRDAYFGVHFCPQAYAFDAIRRGCPVPSPGAARFGAAIAAAVDRLQHAR